MATEEPWLEGLSDDWASQSNLSANSNDSNGRHSETRQASFNPPRSPITDGNISQNSKIPCRTPPCPRVSPNPASPSKALASKCAKSRRANDCHPCPTASVSQSPQVKSRALVDSFSTMNIKAPVTGHEERNTPEWKRRLLRGDAPEGENGDLFGPIKLEKIFTPPCNSESKAQLELSTQNLQNQSALGIRASRKLPVHETETLSTKDGSQKLKLLRSWDKENINLTWMEHMSEVCPADLSRLLRESRLSVSDLDIGLLKRDFSQLSIGSVALPTNNQKSRSASGIEESKNEVISPVLLPTHILLGDAKSLPTLRPSSRASDSHCDRNPEESGLSAEMGDSVEITNQSLPEGLSMGTQAGRFANMRQEGGNAEENSFQKSWLSPALTNSQLPSSAAASRVRNRQASTKRQENSWLAPPRPPFTPKRKTSKVSPSRQFSGTGGLKSPGSPLKLFGHHDTFTNNKLLRRMSQFEESFEVPLEEGPSCAIASSDDSEKEPEEHENGTERHFPLSVPSATTGNIVEEHDFHPSRSSDKRILNSPTKGSAPKRRRTLVLAEHAGKVWHEPIIESAEFSSVLTSPKQLNNSPGRSRLPQAIKPSTPKLERPNTAPVFNPGRAGSNSSPLIALSKPAVNLNTGSCPRIFKHAPAIFPIRKNSITTQDYLDEATKVMDQIRALGGRKAGVSEFEPVAEEGSADAFSDASTKENFSRPPSREGARLRKKRSPNHPDPRIVSHLRKFEDSDELDVFMGASVMSLQLRSRQKALNRLDSHAEDSSIESSPAGIRIHEGIQHIDSKGQNGHDSNFPSNDLGISKEELRSATSIESIATGSTGSARAKGIISSKMISHLIPEKVGAMTYDRDHNMWIKGSQTREQPLTSYVSEDDPFRDIPDLSVDELRELKSIGSVPRVPVKLEQLDHETHAAHPIESNKPNGKETESRPQTQDGCGNSPLDASSVHSKSSRFTSSEPQPETRATSWATGDLTSSSALPTTLLKSDASQFAGGQETVSPLETQELQSPIGGGKKKSRAVSIMFSSPLVSHISYVEADVPADEDHASKMRFSAQDLSTFQFELDNRPKEQKPARTSSPTKQIPVFSHGKRRERQISQNYGRVPGEIGDTHLELSVLPAGDELSLVAPQDSRLDTSYSFHLSPLSEFTMHQADESMRLEVSYVAERTHPHSLKQVHGTFALAVEELIRHITDVEPYEAYWEHLRRLNLRGKKLITLLRLNKYCTRLEELNASDNNIGQLSGVPISMRSLNVSRNSLSNLTAWSHLVNLQYLDLSNNNLDNLDGLSGLVHLRGLKANNNKLTCINGIFDLDGLLTLKARNNRLTSVDFRRAELFRLTNLDLSGNEIRKVGGIDCLTSLETLDLQHNEVHELPLLRPLTHLRTLKLSHNHLQNLDVSVFPALHLLYVDCNHLSSIDGLEECQHLDTLSIREQTALSELDEELYLLPIDIDLSINVSLRKAYLSCNRLSPSVLVPVSPVLTLQLLDLASCGLEDLPPSFGRKFPNLSSLNLNFNAISDVNSLDGISRLSRLFLVGNRLSRLRRLCQVLRNIGGREGSFSKIDLRGNPLTIGFYPSPVSGNGKLLKETSHEDHSRTKMHQLIKRKNSNSYDDDDDDDDPFVPLGGMTDIARIGNDDQVSLIRSEDKKLKAEIDDPYTIPPANSDADQKYLVRLDEATRLRRRAVELMIHSSTSSRLKVLDGLDRRGGDVEVVDLPKDWVWERLVELGVLRKRR